MRNSLRKVIFKMLESVLVKAMLAKLLLSSTSLQGWIIAFLTEEAFEKILVPIMNSLIRSGELYSDNMSGKVQLRSLRKAEEDKDLEEYDDRLRDILS